MYDKKSKDSFEVNYDRYLVDRISQMFHGSWGTVIKNSEYCFYQGFINQKDEYNILASVGYVPKLDKRRKIEKY